MQTHRMLPLIALACAAQAATAADWRFIVTGDSRSNSNTINNGVNIPVLSEMARAIAADTPDFVLFEGDLVYNGSYVGAALTPAGLPNPFAGKSSFQTWKDTMAPVYNAGIEVYPIRGNHDVEAPTKLWYEAFKADIPDTGPTGEVNRTFSFTHKNAFIVGLDMHISGQQYRVNQSWLDTQFAANTQPFVFVMGHAPAFSVHKRPTTTGSYSFDQYAAQRDTFWKSLRAEGARTYFAAHDHFYDHARIDDGDGNPANDIHQFVTGTAGAYFAADDAVPYGGTNTTWKPVRTFHEGSTTGYLVVDIDDDVDCTYLKGLESYANCATATVTWKHKKSTGYKSVLFSADEPFTYAVGYPTTVPHIPEPGTFAMFGFGALALLAWRRREQARGR